MSVTLSDAAAELLVEASRDKKQRVSIRNPIGKYQASTNGRHFADEKPDSTPLRWESAVSELVIVGYLEQGDSRWAYQVTLAGQEAAVVLR